MKTKSKEKQKPPIALKPSPSHKKDKSKNTSNGSDRVRKGVDKLIKAYYRDQSIKYVDDEEGSDDEVVFKSTVAALHTQLNPKRKKKS